MKRKSFEWWYEVIILLLAISPAVKGQSISAKDVMQKAMDHVRGKTSRAEMTIRTIRPTWSREMTVRTWSKGEEYAVVQVMAPPKDKGVAFLKRKKEVWNWIPTLERSIKLPPSMMSQSWMGTDFTNDDLVRESSMVNDYDQKFVGDTLLMGRSCYIIEMIPKPEAAIVWGKLLVYIDKQDYLELYTRFFDEDGTLASTMIATEIKVLGGRLVPSRVEMIPADKKNQKTEIIYLGLQYDAPIDDNFFTLTKLKNLN